jgi:hypothetical protein
VRSHLRPPHRDAFGAEALDDNDAREGLGRGSRRISAGLGR